MDRSETFVLEIEDTRNNTWQGSVTWVRKQKTETFRSALELVQLLSSAVSPEERHSDGCPADPEDAKTEGKIQNS